MPLKNFLLPLILLFIISCSPRDPLAKLERSIEEKIDRASGTYAIAFKDLMDEKGVLLINEKEVFHAASTMKTPVMIEAYKQAAEGQFKMEDSLVIKNDFRSILDGSPYQMSIDEDSEEKLYGKIGEKASIYDLVYDMIIYSSNLATNIVIEKLGAKSVTETMRALGAPDIQVLRGVEDIKAYEKGMNNTTTAFDLLAIFEKIGQGNAVNQEASDAMIEVLLDQKFNEGIPALLPEGVKVAHKTGWISTASHDSALLLLPDGRKYVLIVLTKDWDDSETATQMITEISKLVFDYYTAGDE